MKFEKKELPNRELELTVHVDLADAQPWLDKAAAHLSEHRPIKGFRPGKAPYQIVKKEFGEAAILEEGLEDIINGTFNTLLDKENIHTYGKVKFDLIPPITKEDIVVYKATVALMPSVTLGDWQNKKIKRQEVTVTDDDMTKALDELATMTITENPVERAAVLNDKAIVDFEVYVDGKIIEGGEAKDFALTLGEGRMIPGFEEKIVGSKAGEKLEFDLSFPGNYQATHLSGKPAKFKINVNKILERVKPPIDDAFAVRVGTKDLADLKSKLNENINKEKLNKEDQRVEIAAIKQITETSTYDPIPQSMIDDSVKDLVHDFEHSLAHQGMKMDIYLQSINKTMDQVKKEFEPRAIERIKSSMSLGKLAEIEKIEITPEEIEAEIEDQRQHYAKDPHVLEDLKRPEYRRHVANGIINRKLIDLIKTKIVE